MDMISQKIRALAPEQDPLRMGMGWTVEDLAKPQIMVESTFGDSHPGSGGSGGRHQSLRRQGGPLFRHRYL